MNKKSQFGPDAIIGIIILLVLSVGGVFFINMFVNGFALNELLSVLGQEIDERCFLVVLPASEGEFVRTGSNINENSLLYKTYSYFDTGSINMNISSTFSKRLYDTSKEFKAVSSVINEGNAGVNGVCVSNKYIGTYLNKLVNFESTTNVICSKSIDIYNPFGGAGKAGVIMYSGGE